MLKWASTNGYEPDILIIHKAESWMIAIQAPVGAPDAVIYHIEVINEDSPFRWEGEVDAKGNVTEISTTGAGVPVVGWFGYVMGTAEGAQFDDYVVILPEGVGEFGIEGVDDAVEAKIRALRDKEEHEKYAHFWAPLIVMCLIMAIANSL